MSTQSWRLSIINLFCCILPIIILLIVTVSCSFYSDKDNDSENNAKIAVTKQALSYGSEDDSPCTLIIYNEHGYQFCTSYETWSTARQTCQDLGMDLVSIDSVEENSFVQSKINADSWTGANDLDNEGSWVWVNNSQLFWSGGAFGQTIDDVYENWDHSLFQPNGGQNENCAMISKISHHWYDQDCSVEHRYVCEEDLCPNDPNKVIPGQCGCGAVDTDSDGDGTADCMDECENDPNHVEPGQCGCVGEENLAPAGTACNDGYCSANDECDGAGNCGSLQECAPAGGNCAAVVHEGHAYSFCKDERDFEEAQSKCQSVVDTELVHISSSEEDSFIKDHLVAPAWIGANDKDQEGEWRWTDDGSQFWSGAACGSSVDGVYANWFPFEPDNFFGQDCAVHKRYINAWRDESCWLHYDYVCESIDLCPNDPDKLAPGECGCGISDLDKDKNGTPDCMDGCPYDSTQTAEGPDGCEQPDCIGNMNDLKPEFECILERPSGERLAVFGVENKSSCIIDVPIGEDNRFVEEPEFRGQPTRFWPGYIRALVTPLQDTLNWRLGNLVATATPRGTICEHIIERGDSPIVLTASKDHDMPDNSEVGHQEIPSGQTFTLPERLRVTVGNASNGEAVFTFRKVDGVQVTCTYRGGASTAEPNSDLERARGRNYHFESCDDGTIPGTAIAGTEWNIEVLSGDPRISRTRVTTHLGFGCSGLLDPPFSPEETVTLRQGFNWPDTEELPTTDSTGLPALRYALIYIESREQIDTLERMGIFYSQLPFFASDLARYEGKCGVVDSTGDLQGVFIYALVPAIVYNLWRNVSISVINSGSGGIAFRAVILPPIPEPSMANTDGTVSWQALKEAGFDYMKQRPSKQPLLGLDIPILDDAIEVVSDIFIAGPIGGQVIQFAEEILDTDIRIVPTLDDLTEATIDLIDMVIEGVQETIGAIDEFAYGSNDVPLDIDVLNRDSAFDTNGFMQCAWGPGIGTELAPHGVEVVVKQKVIFGIITHHTGHMNSEGKVSIKAAKGSDYAGICVHMENDAAMVSDGINENIYCDFTKPTWIGGTVGNTLKRRLVYRISNANWNYLTQITDSYDYTRRVIDHDPKQAEIAVGWAANLIGEFQKQQEPAASAFVGCFDYPEMSNSLAVSTILPALLPALIHMTGNAIGGFGLAAFPFFAKDIYFPEGTSAERSRNTATHEYGHFLMCDILSEQSGALTDLYVQRAIVEGLEELADDETGISMESFADLFASQVNSGVNYVELNNKQNSLSNDYCIGSFCLEENFHGDATMQPIMDPFHEQIQRLVTLYHDALDRPTDDWRSQNIPTNGDAWTLQQPSGTPLLLPNVPSSWNLWDVDDEVMMSGPSIRDWILRSAGGSIDTHEMLSNLAAELLETHTWCQVCPMFAMHDPDVAPSATLQEQWQACQSGLVGDFLSSPPDPNLRLSAEDCTICSERQYSNADGVCVRCPGVTDYVDGNTCKSCPRGWVAEGDTCVECKPNEIVLSNTCHECGGIANVADRSGTYDVCVSCPADAVLDVSNFQMGQVCGETYIDIASISVPNDICPDTFWLHLDNIQALGTGQPLESELTVHVVGYGPTSSGDCSYETGYLGVGLGYKHISSSDHLYSIELSDGGTECALSPLTQSCLDTCLFSFPSDVGFPSRPPPLVKLSPADNLDISRVRIGLTPQTSAPKVRVEVAAWDVCGVLE